MGPYIRMYHFSGSDEQYICFLEKALQALGFHHRNCGLQLLSPPITESHRATKRRRNLDSLPQTFLLPSAPENLLVSTSSNGVSSTQSSTASSILPNHNCTPGGEKPLKKAQSWKKAADALIKATPAAKEWKTPWIVKDPVTSYDCHSPTKLILGSSPPDEVSEDVETGFKDEALAKAAHFARTIRYCGDTADLLFKIKCFREIVLASICIVLLDCGKLQKDVDSVMKIHISNAKPKHLNRLRYGAKWANSLVNELHWHGWGNRAQEVLFLCKSHEAMFDCTVAYESGGKPLAAYGAFSDYQNETLPYLVMRLSGHEYTNGIATSVPENHLIPSLVRNVIGTPVK
jgi:hypothetical protein